jgi:phage RecT family recombinase
MISPGGTTMNEPIERQTIPLIEFRGQLEQRTDEFAAALPSHIKPEHFQRVALTAVQVNPKLLTVERRSLLTALMRCAQDGLIPDGRQAALVIFNTRERGPIAQYMPMVAGIRRLVQQSGEIVRFEQQIVYENEVFDFELGDDPYLHHRRALSERGPAMGAYSIAQFRDGSRSYEWMSTEEIEQVRRVSRAAAEGPWVDWWSEMARKTVAKRHAKSLPMANDIDAVFARDDEAFTALPALAPAAAPKRPARALLDEAFDHLARKEEERPVVPPKRRPRRGRRRKELVAPPVKRRPGRARKATPTADEIEAQRAVMDGDEPVPTEDYDQSEPPEVDATDPDFKQGMADRQAGSNTTNDPGIRKDQERFRRWRMGFYHG